MDEIQEVAPSAEVTAPPLSNKNRIVALIVVVVLALGFGLGMKMGVFASSIGTSLDDGLTQQFASFGGEGMVVGCPPSAKFYAGATIICNVIGTNGNALMPNLKFINVTVMTHGQYRALPVNGY